MALAWGIDIGVGSVALAVIELDSNGHPQSLKDGSVEVFSSAISGEERRLKRTMRIQNRRRCRRLRRLRKLLVEQFGLSDGFDRLSADLPIQGQTTARNGSGGTTSRVHLRARGLSEALTPGDLGRAIMHVAQNRGRRLTRAVTVTARKADQEDQEDATVGHRAIATQQALQDLGRALGHDEPATPGQLLYRDVLAGKPSRLRKDHADAPVFTRHQVDDELARLLSAQQPFHPALADAVVTDIRTAFAWEKPARQARIGFCRYGVERSGGSAGEVERRLRKLSHLAETKRLYESINNLRLRDRITAQTRCLTMAQRDCVVGHAMAGETVTAANLRTWLHLGKAATAPLTTLDEIKTGRSGRKEGSIRGHAIAAAMTACDVADVWQRATDDEREAIAGLLAGSDDLDAVTAGLRNQFAVPEAAAETLAKMPMPSGYTMAGPTATARLLAELQADVVSLHEAERRLVEAGRLVDPDGETARPTGGDPLPYYGALFPLSCVGGTRNPADPPEVRFGRVPNPVVHLALNRLRKVAKCALKRHGRPTRINIELARDLNRSPEDRDLAEAINRSNRRKNEEWSRCLASKGLAINRDNLRKLKLHELQGAVCLYTGDPICMDHIANGDVDIDHILPWDATLDDRLGNLALCFTQANREKGKQTPYQAFSKGYRGQDYAAILKRVKKHRTPSLWRFEEGALKKYEEKGYLPSRFLSDTRFIAKMARRYLEVLLAVPDDVRGDWRDVVCLSGGITAILRRRWGLGSVIKDIMVAEGRLDPSILEPCPDVDQEIERRRVLEKIRWDHRHHLLDAIVAACTQRSDIQRIQTMMAKRLPSEKPEETIQRLRTEGVSLFRMVGLPWRETFRKTVREFLLSVGAPGDRTAPVSRVRHKPDHGVQGRLHAETFYRIICKFPGRRDQFVTAHHADLGSSAFPSVKSLEALRIERTVRNAIEQAIENGLIDEFGWGGSDPRNALAQLLKSRDALIGAVSEALSGEPTRDADGRKRGEATIVGAALDAVRRKTGQRRVQVFAIKSVRIIEAPVKPGRPPRRAVETSGNDRLVSWLSSDELASEIEVVSTLDANSPEFQEEWQRKNGTLLFRARIGDVLELFVTDPKKDPNARRALYRLVSMSVKPSLDLELQPLAEARPVKETRSLRPQASLRVGKDAFMARAPQLVVLAPDGRERWRSRRHN